MEPNVSEWSIAKDRLVAAIKELGFPEALGEAVARHLGSPKAMGRMISYLENVRPEKEELIVDEMLSIRSEFDAWREKKQIVRQLKDIMSCCISGFKKQTMTMDLSGSRICQKKHL